MVGRCRPAFGSATICARTEVTAQILGSDSFEVVELRYDQHNHKTVKVTHNYMRSPSEDDGPVPAYREVGRGAQA